MAIIQNIILRGAKKRLGGAVLYQQAGRTLARELAAEVSNPRTDAQMTQRVKWANLVAFYRANKGWMRKAFEGKKPTQSDYNKFMSLNVANSNIYLTKQEAAVGSCVVGPYKITEGSLPSIEVYGKDTDWVTNIYVEPDLTVSPTLTVAEFSQCILNNNAGLREGDQLSFIRITQQTNNQSGTPYVLVRAYEVMLSRSNNELLASYWPVELLQVSDLEGKDVLCITNNGNMGAFSIVLSRTIAGKTIVSTQWLTLVNMASMLSSYTSEAQLNLAQASYGQQTDVFLDSNAAGYATAGGAELSLMYVKVGDRIVRANELLGPYTDLEGKRLELVFNKTLAAGEIVDWEIYGGENGKTLEGTISGNTYTTEMLEQDEDFVGTLINKIIANSNTAAYEINFSTRAGFE